MASTYRIEMNRYNGTDYDTLLPKSCVTRLVSLSASGWNPSEKVQSVTVDGVDADTTVIVSPAPASFTAYGAAGIYCSAQGTNSLTFRCAKVPSTSIIVNVALF